MKPFVGIAAALALAGAVLALSAVPAIGADSGTVTATITAATPCLTLSGTTVSFGSAPFSTSTTASFAQGSPHVTVANCGSGNVQLFAKGTDATTSTGVSKAIWLLGDVGANSCAMGSNRYGIAIQSQGMQFESALLTTDRLLQSLGAGESTAINPLQLTMPCTGSAGAGDVMTLQITFTAAF